MPEHAKAIMEELDERECRRLVSLGGSYSPSLTPTTTVRSVSLPGAHSSTFRAPSFRCSAASFWASSETSPAT